MLLYYFLLPSSRHKRHLLCDIAAFDTDGDANHLPAAKATKLLGLVDADANGALFLQANMRPERVPTAVLAMVRSQAKIVRETQSFSN